MVSNPVLPISPVRFENLSDRLAGSPTGSRSLSKWTLGFVEIRETGLPYTEFKKLGG